MKLLKLAKLTAISLVVASVSVYALNTCCNHAEKVASFKGQQLTGITVSQTGRIFTNFPKWREGVKNDVVEVFADNVYSAYPNEEWNSWNIGDEVTDNKFISVQSVVDHGGKLYVLDTANPMFKGLLTSPRLFVFDLETNKLEKTYKFKAENYKPNSYYNDLRVDDKLNKVYITDSGEAGLIVLDIATGDNIRVLDNSKYTKADTNHLMFNGKKWENVVHSDGIALDRQNDILFIHALTGYWMYGFKTSDLTKEDPQPVSSIKTAAPDGMFIDKVGNLYFADLENHKIQYLMEDRKTIKTLVEGRNVKWADTFDVYNCELYYTNSRIHEATGDISNLEFTINKVDIPVCNK